MSEIKKKKKYLTLKEAALLEIYRKPFNLKYISEQHRRRLEKIKSKMGVVG